MAHRGVECTRESHHSEEVVMPCTEAFATWQEFAHFWCQDEVEEEEEEVITTMLDIAATDMHIAMGGVGACDCTLATWAIPYLRKLNIIDAMVIHNCPCGRVPIATEMKRTWLEWLNGQLKMIMEGKIELCAGHTASEYPSVMWAEQANTAWNAAKIIDNTARRNS
jgi:hypothetical protein